MVRSIALAIALLVAIGSIVDAQTTKKPPPRKTPAPALPPVTRIAAEVQCPSELGIGIKTGRRFCDVLTARDPEAGVIVTIPPHRGPLMLFFELHNRHTYSEELIKAKKAYRQYTATIGVLTLNNDLIDRAVILSEFRTAADVFDRIDGGAGPGGMKAVAPVGSEFIAVELPETVTERVSILGEKLMVRRPDGADQFLAPGRPIATISNVFLEYRPGPPPRKK
jgi:hypothetical protein